MEELGASELGTHEYWEKRYSEEIHNFASHGDHGEVWFGEDIVDRIIRWLNEKNIPKTSKIVDVGCGNGMLLVELANENYTNLFGLDYADKAIELAKAIASKQSLNISYAACNILEGLNDTYDVIHDKGTYDAISLSEDATKNRNCYIESVYKGLNDGGIFIITSCNWTQSELDAQFEQRFVREDIIPTPQFKFGGKVGSVVTSCVFKRKM